MVGRICRLGPYADIPRIPSTIRLFTRWCDCRLSLIVQMFIAGSLIQVSQGKQGWDQGQTNKSVWGLVGLGLVGLWMVVGMGV